jgi:hypothetical protein
LNPVEMVLLYLVAEHRFEQLFVENSLYIIVIYFNKLEFKNSILK